MTKTSGEVGKDRSLLWVIVLSLAILLPFAANSFSADDFGLILRVSTGGPFAIWTSPPTLFFRPLISVAMWLNYLAGGWASWAYYVPNFLLHAVNTGLVLLIAKRFLAPTSLTPGTKMTISSLAALIFMSTPSHVEALFFMSCRTDLLAALFGLLSILTFLRAVEEGSGRLSALSIGLLFVGCLCKESVYAIFLLFGGIAYVGRADRSRARLAGFTAAGGLLVVAASALLRSRVVSAALPYGAGSHSLAVQVAKDAARVVLMLFKPMLPVDLGIVSGRSRPILTTSDGVVLALVLIVTAGSVWTLVRPMDTPSKRPSLIPPLGAFLATALPACILAMPVMSPENGRLMYLPSAFSAILLAFVASTWLKGSAIRVLGAGFVCCAVAFTFLNGALYRDASGVCGSTVNWLKSNHPPGGNAVFLVPDSVGGRYIWRNGFDTAMQAFAPEWAGTPFVVAVYKGAGEFRESPGGETDLRGIEIVSLTSSHMGFTPEKSFKAVLIFVSNTGAVRELKDAGVVLPDVKGN